MTVITKKYKIGSLPYSIALYIAKIIKSGLRADGAKIGSSIVGSLRRKSPSVRDIDLLICTDRPITTIAFGTGVEVIEQYADGDCKKSYVISIKLRPTYVIKLDIFFAIPTNRPFALMHHTGNKNFNIKMRAHAKRIGLKLNQYGIFKGTKRAYGSKKIKTERDIFRFFGIDYLPASAARTL
jgi:DNA polymerase (family 10)